jgi:hypothetical protein
MLQLCIKVSVTVFEEINIERRHKPFFLIVNFFGVSVFGAKFLLAWILVFL